MYQMTLIQTSVCHILICWTHLTHQSTGVLKKRQRTRNKRQSKRRTNDYIKNRANLTAKLLKELYNSKATIFKLDGDPIHRRVYLLNSMMSLKILLSKFRETCIMLM